MNEKSQTAATAAGNLAQGLLLSEALPQFLEHLRVEEGRAPVTLVRYRSQIERFRAVVGDIPVDTIDGECASRYKRHLLEAALSPATISTALAVVRSFLRYLRNVRQISVYEPEKVRRPRVPTREVEFLTQEEVNRFLAAIPDGKIGLRDRALAAVLCSTGMRISEALALTRSAIDWEAKEARIVGKGNKQRTVYFTDEAIEALYRYLEARQDHNQALFMTTGDDPRPLGAQATWRRFRRYALRAGLSKKVYPHMLRHTMATTLLTNGCPIGHIRVLLGHAHLATTCRYYLGRMSDAEAKAAHGKFLVYKKNVDNKTIEKSPRG